MAKKTIMKIPKGANIQLTKNFSSSELDCKCNNEDCTYTLIDLEHIVQLQKLRDVVGRLSITSGYRCKKHNKAVGGSSRSQHLLGTATDLVPHNYSILDLFNFVNPIFKGVGKYKTFIHVDSREGSSARWGTK